MLTTRHCLCALCKKIIHVTRDPDILPECHNNIRNMQLVAHGAQDVLELIERIVTNIEP